MSDIRPLTEQEVFDTIYREYVLGDAKPALSTEGGALDCVYRTSDGRRCFIGRFIPEHEYKPWIENLGIRELFKAGCPAETKLLLSGCDIDFLAQLQLAHDGVWGKYPDEIDEIRRVWEGELKRLAETYNLTIPETP